MAESVQHVSTYDNKKGSIKRYSRNMHERIYLNRHIGGYWYDAAIAMVGARP